jgi:hypothetical protein
VLNEWRALEERHSDFHLHFVRFVQLSRLPPFMWRAWLLSVFIDCLQAYFRLVNDRALLELLLEIKDLVCFTAYELLTQFFFRTDEDESFEDLSDLWNTS